MKVKTFKLKNILILFITFISLTTYSQTQYEMNMEASKKFYKADEELNLVYNKIRNKYKSDKEFLKNLKLSQNIWIKFRDAEMLVKYPENQQNIYGSVFSMCYSGWKEKLTIERTKRLKEWLKEYEDGDVCSGSLR